MRTFFLVLIILLAVFIVTLPFSSFFSNVFITPITNSFAILGGLSSFGTLIIAIILYQRFGLETKFVEKKADKVLELVELLKEFNIRLKFDNGTYLFKFRITNIKEDKRSNFIYQNLYSRTLVLNDNDYQKSTENISKIINSYWLPEEIKVKLKYLISFVAFDKPENIKGEMKIAKLVFNNSDYDEWYIGFPEMTVEDFQQNTNELLNSIQKWLRKYSNIKLDLKFQEVKK